MTAASVVLIVEDHELLAQSLEVQLQLAGFIPRVLIAAHDSQVRHQARSVQPDVVLLDLDLAATVSDGAAFIPDLVATGAVVIVMTGSEDPRRLLATLEAGAAGIISKTAPASGLIQAVRDAVDGRPIRSEPDVRTLERRARAADQERAGRRARFDALTRREQQVLAALQRGEGVDAIAEAEFLSVATVRSHVRGILTKLNVTSQLAAVAEANNAGWTLEEST